MIFVDTWAWIGLAVKKDQYHAVVQAQHEQFCRTGRRYVTTDHVLTELITYLYNVGPAITAESFVSSLLAAYDLAGRRVPDSDLVVLAGRRQMAVVRTPGEIGSST